MPTSVIDGKDYTANFILNKQPKTILDVGVGEGTYSSLLKEYKYFPQRLDGIEIWEPYLAEFDLKNKYDNLYLHDIRTWQDFDYDMVIFGDVLEHMTQQEAIFVWEKAAQQAKYGIISIPIVYLRQGMEHGNPYEEHVKDDWTTKEVLNSFNGITKYKEYKKVGVFIAEF
jgi:cyclopropane fatty-acyl-phospholipid synthase-like methyltransferase